MKSQIDSLLRCSIRIFGDSKNPSLARTANRLLPQDVFLVSYPRSGNTWVRTIVAHLCYDKRQIRKLKDLDYLVPDIHRGLPVRKGNKQLVVKTHNAFSNRSFKDHPYGKIIYLARHPFDVVRSYHHYNQGINNWGGGFEAFVEQFTRGVLWPCSWQEHVLSWEGAKGNREMLLVKYENLIHSPASQIQRIADFLDIPISTTSASEVAEQCSRESMIDLERKGSLVQDDFAFIRRSAERRYTKQSLTDSLRAKIEKRCREALAVLQYRAPR